MDDDQEIHDTHWNGTGTTLSADFHSRRKRLTRDEVRDMKEASDLFKSTSFKLQVRHCWDLAVSMANILPQIEALFPNVRPKPSRICPLERFLFTLHSFMKSLPAVEPQHPLEASRKLRESGIEVPYSFPLPTQETKWKVAFEAPSDITLVGSWGNKISVKAQDERKYGVDLALEMPSVCLDILCFHLALICYRTSFKKRIISMGAYSTSEHTTLPFSP